jgi:7,8-dihydroneopterin aldolase/epimerase/oxygenase
VTTVELHGLEVYGYHGATEVEQREGQTFLFDVKFELQGEPEADELEHTVDYREVAACVREVSDGRRLRLLESLAAAVADELMARFAFERVRVRVRKPHVQLDPPAEHSAAIVERP